MQRVCRESYLNLKMVSSRSHSDKRMGVMIFDLSCIQDKWEIYFNKLIKNLCS
jgi:hypothetical protein